MNDPLVSATASLSISANDEPNRVTNPPAGDDDLLLLNFDVTQLTLLKIPPCSISLKEKEDCASFHPVPLQFRSTQTLPCAAGPLITGSLEPLEIQTKGDAKVVYRATIVLEQDQTMDYRAGDCISLLCANSNFDVQWLLDRVDLSPLNHPDQPFTLETTRPAKPVPAWLSGDSPVTARFLLTYCCELYIPITRRITRLLAECCSTESGDETAKKQSEQLLYFSSREGSKLFEKYIQHHNMNFMDLIYTYPALRIPLANLLEILTRLQPRSYTLISLKDDRDYNDCQVLQFLYTRVDFQQQHAELKTLQRYPHRKHGVCTGGLEAIHKFPSPVQLYLRRNLNAFRLPEDVTRPVIMIGAGTGIAPFISFIRQCRQDHSKQRLWLIYGCRSPETSLLMSSVLAETLDEGVLHKCCLCFSRYSMNDIEPELPQEVPEILRQRSCKHALAHYVQNCVYQPTDEVVFSAHRKTLADWVLHERATIMVCGEARAMAPAVASSWHQLLTLFISSDDTNAGEEYVRQMRKEGRYLEDIWT